ncbi:type I restriction enzyme S subunit [Caldalkalibacillus uzonensis]|uniref:Type I restriction enzyme S subunit n=1 Tax=Caldalkalibacillus uzonensis TaxID=353224 RepID=A0ABU0CVT3_9BACI|nr:restriction endonuclease subunit S [Caldalkalibacillus uzonensis]MDQ0340523.1 type I restriction enzyme S subunit [Caldalkalibacillus uzonensis]
MSELLKHLHDAVQTEEDVDLLREKILDLAFRGKLVPQDPNDEPVTVLLEKIQKEKEQLIREKIIRRPKKLLPIKKEEIPYKIPESWVWVRLGDIGLINPRSNIEDSIEVSFIPMKLIHDGFSNKYSYKVKKWCTVKKGYTHVREGDVVVAKITPCFENRKSAVLSKLVNGYGAATTELHVFRPLHFSLIIPEYILFLFKTKLFIDKGVSTYTGTAGQQRVSKSFFEDTLVPLPPFNEQKRIVTKVDELMALCDELVERIKQKNNTSSVFNKTVFTRIQDTNNTEVENDIRFVLEHMDSLVHTKEDVQMLRNSILSLATRGKLVPQDPSDEPASVLLEKIQEEKERFIKEKKMRRQKALPTIKDEEIPYKIPESWEWVRLDDITLIRRGASPRPIKSFITEDENGVPWIKIGDAEKSNKYITSTKEKITKEGAKKSVYLTSGSLIMSNSMSFGKAYILGINGCIHDGWLSFQVFKKYVNNEWLLYFLNGSFKQFEKKAVGTGVKNLNIDRVRATLIPVPPFNEQKRIVAKVDELMKICDELEKRIEEYEKSHSTLIRAILAS